VRRDSGRFIVLPGHDEPDIEQVVETHRAYRVVEKEGEARRAAEEDAED